MPAITTGELARLLAVDLQGDENVTLEGVSGIAEAKQGDLSFIHSPKYVPQIQTTRASALIIPQGMETDFRPVLRCENPYLTFAKAISVIAPQAKKAPVGVHPTAILGAGVRMGEGVSIQANVVVEDNAFIGEHTVLYPMSYVGQGSVIGDNCIIYPRVTIGERVAIGSRTTIHPGTNIGGDLTPNEQLVKSNAPFVEIGEEVEIGANGVIANGKDRTTQIGAGTKIDNLVRISSGAQIGRSCILVAQTGVGENSTLEDGVTLAGQASVCDGLHVGKGAIIAAQSVVETDVPPGEVYYGFPARPHDQEMRLKVCINRLPKLFKTVKQLQEKLKEKSKE